MTHLRGLAGEPGDIVIGDPHEALRILEWQRTQQQRVHHAKESRARADAQSHDQNCKSGEAGIAP